MPNKNADPLIKLPEETRQRLALMEVDMVKARKALKSLKSLNMDTADMEAKLDWAEDVRKTLLSEFS